MNRNKKPTKAQLREAARARFSEPIGFAIIHQHPGRIVVEAYPGVLARAVTTESYKNDNRKKQTPGQREARGRILEALTSGALSDRYGLTVVANEPEFVDDPTGDRLDALLCAVQAAWAWRNLTTLLDEVADIDPREGWIADPGGV